jgi:hypothetical protein
MEMASTSMGMVKKLKMQKPTTLNTWRTCRNSVCRIMEDSNEAVNHGQTQPMYNAVQYGHALQNSGDRQVFFYFRKLTNLFPVHHFSSFACD